MFPFLANNIIDDLKGWSLKGYSIFFVAIAAMIIICISFESSWIEIVSSITGVIGVILIAQAKLSGYFYAIIATSTYAFIAYQYHFFGEAIAYAFLFLPLQFIGYFHWFKNLRKDKNKKKVEVITKKLTTQQTPLLITFTFISIFIYALLMQKIGGHQPGLDSATAVLNVVGTLLMVLRYQEQWLAWIAVNITAIALWVLAVLENKNEGMAILAMWTIYLINSIYGYIVWRQKNKLEKI
ncbi:nicotinamide riboside transporter PnuC [Thorsellia kenyensis]|uniref:Nicotinamide riboside transporter PnuC n=1 Tax=Thorsellia kenyensis TaxID=1549888 RepID=A0ABV6C8R0_9GAMM